jgi:hypothetical protein
MPGLGYGGRRRKSRRGGAKYGKKTDDSSRRRTMRRFVRNTPTINRGDNMAFLARRVDAETRRADAEYRANRRGMPRIRAGPNLNNQLGPAGSPLVPLVLPDQNPERNLGPAFMVVPNHVPGQGQARSLPGSPVDGPVAARARLFGAPAAAGPAAAGAPAAAPAGAQHLQMLMQGPRPRYSAPPSPVAGGRSRKSRRRHK